jgi:hypothetical protein
MNRHRFLTPLIGALIATTRLVGPASAQPTLKAVDVTIEITGISHLVDGERYPDKERTLVVTNHHGWFGSGHHLFLLVNSDDFADTKLLEGKRTRDFNGQKVKYAYREFPDGYEIDLVASGWFNASPQLNFKEDGDKDKPNAGDPNAECPDGNKTSLHWLPRLSTVSGTNLTVKKSHTDANPSAKDVLTRIAMKDGTLEASVHPATPKYEFKIGGANNHKQAVADSLIYKFTAYVKDGDYFVLQGRKFNPDTNAPQEWQELARVMPVNSKVIFMLANVIEDDFFNPMITHTLDHFDKFYAIIESPPVKAKPVYVMNCNNSGNNSGIECGPDRVP